MSKLNEYGQEIPDPKPMALPVGFKRPEPLAETIRRLVHSEQWRMAMERSGAETMTEADDFDIPDDPLDPASPYEENFDPVVPFIAARHDEQKGGQVATPTLEEVANAREVLSRASKPPVTAPPAPATDPKGSVPPSTVST